MWDTVIFHLPLFRTNQRTSAGPLAAAGAVRSSCQDNGTRGGRRRRRTKTTTAAGTRGRRRRRRRRCGTHLLLPAVNAIFNTALGTNHISMNHMDRLLGISEQ